MIQESLPPLLRWPGHHADPADQRTGRHGGTPRRRWCHGKPGDVVPGTTGGGGRSSWRLRYGCVGWRSKPAAHPIAGQRPGRRGLREPLVPVVRPAGYGP